MLLFRVAGPFEVHPTEYAAGRMIDKGSSDRFWAEHGDLASEVGCYVFGFRASHGLIPAYVGQSKTGFKHECFQHHKLTHYNSALLDRIAGTPIMFFVLRSEGSTGVLETCIDQLEHFLIQLAAKRNPELENVHRVDWAIQGVWRSRGGQPSQAALSLRKLLSFHEESMVAAPSSEERDESSQEEAAIS